MAKRTVVFPLDLLEDQVNILYETLTLYSQSCSRCIDVAWDMRTKKISTEKVHDLTYYPLRQELGLKSQYVCSSRNKAIEMVKSARDREKKNKRFSKPGHGLIPIRLDARTLSFNSERTYASVATQGERIKIPLTWHRQARRYENWFCQSGEIGIDKWGRWNLWLVFEKKFKLPERTGVVYGGDRGIAHVIVISNNKFYGERWWAEHERKSFLHIARLQSKGTKSAKRRLKKVFRKLRRFRENCDRVIAKQIIASLQPGDTIVLEILTHIRDRCGVKGKAHKKHRRKIGRWSFKRLENAIRYHAELSGIYVECVKAHYTSQMCSKCGVVSKSNRKNQALYSCKCGLRLNADLNAARNIAERWRIANGFASGPPLSTGPCCNACSVQAKCAVTSP